MLNEISQPQKEKYSMIPVRWVSKIIKFIEAESQVVVVRKEGRENGELLIIGFKASFTQDE